MKQYSLRTSDEGEARTILKRLGLREVQGGFQGFGWRVWLRKEAGEFVVDCRKL